MPPRPRRRRRRGTADRLKGCGWRGHSARAVAPDGRTRRASNLRPGSGRLRSALVSRLPGPANCEPCRCRGDQRRVPESLGDRQLVDVRGRVDVGLVDRREQAAWSVQRVDPVSSLAAAADDRAVLGATAPTRPCTGFLVSTFPSGSGMVHARAGCRLRGTAVARRCCGCAGGRLRVPRAPGPFRVPNTRYRTDRSERKQECLRKPVRKAPPTVLAGARCWAARWQALPSA